MIEDEAGLREEVMDWLSFEGHEVSEAGDGLSGIETALGSVPDLIICDISMPRMDGYDVLLELHANSATASIPFIFMTAKATHDDIRKGMTLGADDYITKPFTRLELLQAIQARVEKKAFQDQEYQLRVDQLQQALMDEHEQRLLKSKLVAMFSHDFRNQLTVIASSATLIRNYANNLTEQRRLERINAIEASAHMLLQMLDDMLVVAQMETGNLTLKPAPVHIEQFFADIVTEFQAVQGDTMRLHFDSSFSETITVDALLLRQIAANLISNAIKYSPVGSEIFIRLEGQEQSCIFSVKDQGIGIPESDQLRLFDAFQRGSNVGKIMGTGLGLAIVKQAVDLLQGAIHLESQVGVGTTIAVMLPCAAPDTNA